MATKPSKKVAKTPAKKTASTKDARKAKALPLSVGKAKAVSESESGAKVEVASTTGVEPETAATTELESTTTAQDEFDPNVSHSDSTSDPDDPNVSKSMPEAELGLDELEPTEEVLADLAHAEAAPESPTAATGATTSDAGGEPKPKAKPAKAPRTLALDPRLPPVGTTIKKLDRHGNVRCECVVEQEGIRFAGTLYPSISAAASAAAKQLGLGGVAQNGFVYWGLQKPPRPAADPVEALTAAWERFHERAKKLVDSASAEERVKLVAALTELRVLDAFRAKAS